MTALLLLVVFVTSLVLTYAVIPVVLRVAHMMQLYDQPDALLESGVAAGKSRRIHTKPIPRLGGIGMMVGFTVSTLIWLSGSPLSSVYNASLIMFFIGMFDDLKPLSAKFRLCVQILAAGLVVYQLNIPILHLEMSPSWILSLPAWLGYFLSVFVIIGAINAVNLTDGLDGLAGGVVMIGVVLLSILYFLSTRDLSLIYCLSLPLLGSLLGFLRYNTHPATIFMGDCGSNWLGMILGVLLVFVLSGTSLIETNGVLASHKNTFHVPVLSGILCVALPVLDTAFVMSRRIIAGKNPMTADKTHFHHTLLHIGLSHSQSVTTIYFLSFLVGILGLMPVAYPAYKLDFVPFLAIGIWILVLTFSLQVDENAAEKMLFFKKKSSQRLKFILLYKKVVGFLEVFNRYLIYAILSVVPLLAGIPHLTLGYASMLGLVLLVIASFGKHDQNFFQSFVISVASAILLTAINFNTLHVVFLGSKYNIQYLYNAIFIILMITTLLYIALTLRRRYFIVTPTDFLMITLPFCFLFVPEPYQTDYKLNIISLRSLIFFVSVRVLTRRYHGAFRRVMFMCAVGLIYVFLVTICGLRFTY
ncbi:MAG: undecaprenyl/decaprenyl-phosphate alpha-N-acetylglucosaminyl 1-phosphate transferase [Proteobacteria bacterium]|nr:MAG: undecaprenyl/decaprenyl-phosphate alpha-N-acetylglucosaminyl 1-phosphate transferase [Pseudomonadota bacterium]